MQYLQNINSLTFMTFYQSLFFGVCMTEQRSLDEDGVLFLDVFAT